MSHDTGWSSPGLPFAKEVILGPRNDSFISVHKISPGKCSASISRSLHFKLAMHLTSGTKPEGEEAARTTFKEKEAIWKERNEQRKAGREEEREKVAKPKKQRKNSEWFHYKCSQLNWQNYN